MRAIRQITTDHWSKVALAEAQDDDSEIGPFKRIFQRSETKPNRHDIDWSDRFTRTLYSDWDRIVDHELVLYRKFEDVTTKLQYLQLIAPSPYREEIFRQSHEGFGGGASRPQ